MRTKIYILSSVKLPPQSCQSQEDRPHPMTSISSRDIHLTGPAIPNSYHRCSSKQKTGAVDPVCISQLQYLPHTPWRFLRMIRIEVHLINFGMMKESQSSTIGKSRSRLFDWWCHVKFHPIDKRLSRATCCAASTRHVIQLLRNSYGTTYVCHCSRLLLNCSDTDT
jgi:hypothetical protein